MKVAKKQVKDKKTTGTARGGKTAMIDFTMKKKDDIGEITMNGTLTAEHVVQLKKTLLSALKKVKHIVVSLGKNAGVDFSVLQLLCSAHRSALRLKKDLRLARATPGVVTAIEAAGFSRCKACADAKRKNCLWILGDMNA